MNLLITGGAGFIGSRFVELMVTGAIPNDFTSFTILDNLSYSGNLNNLESILHSPKISFHKVDICDRSEVEQIIVERSIDYIVNFAAESHVDRSIVSSHKFFQTNLMGTHNLIELAREHAITRFLQISTDEVYGSIEKGSWTEEEPLKPNSPYSASKASADLLVLAFGKTHNMNVGITRSCNNYGLRQFPEKIIPLFITNLIRGRQLPIYGSGNQIREWIHVDDHCRAIAKILVYGKPGEIYNIAGADEFQNLELAKMILAYFGKNETDALLFVEDRKGHDFRYSLTGKKFLDEFGEISTIKFATGLKETIDWYISNEAWWRENC